MNRPLFFSCALLACVVLGGAYACSDGAAPATCHDIPANGCPEDGNADVCQDVTCSAVYACNNGQWVLAQTCPPHPDAGGSEAGAGAHDAGVAQDAAIDAPPGAFGGPGCVDLQPPDCPLGTALLCGGASDCCGCQSLFVCDDGGWDPWGSCVDGAAVKQN